MSISNDLRQAVLQAAIQGKLTKQLPVDGNAKDLLEQIKAEKEKLVKEGKLKKEKPLPEITEDEKPFDIPENWEWCRVTDVTLLNPKNSLEDDLSVSFIPMTCVTDGFSNNHTFEIKKWGEIKKGFSHFTNGDVGVAKITPCFQNRKSVVFKDLKNNYGAGTTELIIVRPITSRLLSKYLLWFFKTENFISDGMKSFTGTAGQQRIHKDYLPNCALPLPPLSEQKRIVAKVEELMAKIDDLEKTEKELEALKKAFPADMKAALLQTAMQGKLTVQLPEDGNAKDLLEQIKAEKAKLIKEGKLKKEKPLPEITEDEKPFDIPENWKWVRLGEIVRVLGGKRIPAGRTLVTENTGHKYIRVSDMKNESVITDGIMFVPEDIFQGIKRYIIKKEDVYITVAGTIGRVGKIPDELDGANLTENADRIVFNNLNQDWLIKCLSSDVVQYQITEITTKVGQPKLAIKRIQELVVPLPPIAEQKRIVEKLEKLLSLCDGLK